MTDAISRLNAALEGRYRIERELGAGGMALVYLAHDLKHGRDVALKVLRPELSAVVGGERFVTEIRTTANLKHPHILPLFDSGEADGFLFYVMPYVEGESLRNRLERETQLPVDEAVRIATKVGSALDHAHRHGVLHRDIKPANILLQDGEPVVADFGIALALGAAGGGRLTETGLSLGTPSYMSPEQATGEQPLDARSDVYSLACVLYETLAGVTPYGEGTPQAILARVVTKDVEPVRRHRRLVPANVDGAIRKALERAPADRFDGAQDFARALADTSFRYGEELVSTGPRPWTLAAVGLAGALLALAGAWAWGPTPAAAPLPLPAVWRMAGAAPNHIPGGDFGIGPMGTGIWYAGSDPTTVWYRAWDELEGHPVTRAASPIHWMSWDGRYLVGSPIRADSSGGPGEIRVVPLEGNEPIRTISIDGMGAYPSDDGFLYFTGSDGRVHRILYGGTGEAELIGPELREGEVYHELFDVLPGGETAIYQVSTNDSEWIEGYDLETGERRHLIDGMSPHFTSTGHLLYGTSDGQIMAARLDPQTLELGASMTVVQGPVPITQGAYLLYEIAADGTLAYWEAPTPELEMVWVDRSGVAEPVDPNWSFHFDRSDPEWALSPDRSKLAIPLVSGDDQDIWIKELPDGTLNILGGSPGIDFAPAWLTPDTVVYLSRETAQWTGSAPVVRILKQPSNGAARVPEVVYRDEYNLYSLQTVGTGPASLLLGGIGTLPGGDNLFQTLLFRPGIDTVPVPMLVSPRSAESGAVPSPDGRWLAYASFETGDWEIFLRPFPDVETIKVRVSVNGGRSPVWSPDGSELYYTAADRVVVAARVETAGSRVRITGHERLFLLTPDYVRDAFHPFGAVGPDGRFLMMRQRGSAEPTFVVIQNFFTELERLLPS